ncbi:MAG TPA: ATP-binding protein [Candidatus Nanoarchaeia archaeon]|nr:ATP-binding protein [Candidatus Nanoarchaeia archaeon]
MREIFKKIIVEWWEKNLPPLIEREIPWKITSDILAIAGPRRVGKTYLIFQIIKKLLQNHNREEILFIDFEDNRLVGLTDKNLDDLFIAYRELTDKELKYIFFDEIQVVDHWSTFVRRLHNTQKYHIIISGSSSKLLSKEIATELRGRYHSIFVSPFSFSEFISFRGLEYSPKIDYSELRGKFLRIFQEYLVNGGYPEVIKEESIEEKKTKMRAYYETTFYKDLVERHKITNYDLLEQLMNYLLNNCSRRFSVTSFEKILQMKGIKVSKKTISLYLKYLEEAFFIYSVEEFSYSAKNRMMRPRKIYLIDNAFVTFLSIQFSPDKGKLLENVVLGHLKRQSPEIFFYNEQKECDFVVKQDQKIILAIQVCYELTEENKKRELKGLLEALDYFKLKEGLILTYDQENSFKVDNKMIKVMPVWKWLLQKPKVKETSRHNVVTNQ